MFLVSLYYYSYNLFSLRLVRVALPPHMCRDSVTYEACCRNRLTTNSYFSLNLIGSSYCTCRRRSSFLSWAVIFSVPGLP